MNTPAPVAAPLPGRTPFHRRLRVMAFAGWSMMFHDRLKLLGSLTGVVFAVILVNQQAGTFLGLLDKNVNLVENVETDLWVLPPFTEQAVAGKPLDESVLATVRGLPGVAWAEPMVLGVASLALPNGATEQVSLVGARAPRFAGGPWSVVAGSRDALDLADTVIMEDSQREKFGNLDLGTVRELNGRRVRTAGFTWGLTAFAPPYAFAELKLARDILGLRPDQQSFVLVGAAPGIDHATLAKSLQERLPEAKVVTKAAYRSDIVTYLLTKTPIGISFGTSAMFGLIIGFITVALSMFSGVLDNIRQFGTLKAVGATTLDLAGLLFTQALTYSVVGTVIGLFLVTRIAAAARSPELAIVLPPELFLVSSALMVVVCVSASLLSLVRLRNIEPAMVFR